MTITHNTIIAAVLVFMSAIATASPTPPTQGEGKAQLINKLSYFSASSKVDNQASPGCTVGLDCPFYTGKPLIINGPTYVDLNFVKASLGHDTPTLIESGVHNKKLILINESSNYKITYNVNGVLCGGTVGDTVQFMATVGFQNPQPTEASKFSPISTATIINQADTTNNIGISGAANAGGQVILNLPQGTKLWLTYALLGYNIENKNSPPKFYNNGDNSPCTFGGFSSYIMVEKLN
ncbi:hypothetical protein [Legionella sp. km772]|uniref:hypothetical protein n=1 Tax=Legionella sp. km772 TaxID=2498111 RepID=UPI000F8E0FBE|nr:hypothetical protein [Legionella sp. km772]RUR13211.1 hypothetical protein ELY15_03110 [Legionella sp. km772]